ncbi:RloB domain-containing protein [Micromonospora sp. HSS6-12]|uniref:RloB domain-containing protein n=1 Tax=Micromonospora thermarum TaxID=2720024 RepID=A0ABX0Z975_9ACTN|nr:RloB domain-containing protein [Micromonospora thermarum]
MPSARGRDSFEARRRVSRRRRDVWVFTEGELTEPQYVDLVKDMQPVRRYQVHIANDTRRDGGRRGSGDGRSDRKPRELVEAAVALLVKLRRQVGAVPDEFAPVVWCIFDRDQHEGIDQAVRRARQAGVKIAFSHPCFELWRLLHQQAYTSTFGGSCEEAARRIRFPPGTTAQQRKAVTWQQIHGGFLEAKKRAIQINEQHDDRTRSANEIRTPTSGSSSRILE